MATLYHACGGSEPINVEPTRRTLDGLLGATTNNGVCAWLEDDGSLTVFGPGQEHPPNPACAELGIPMIRGPLIRVKESDVHWLAYSAIV